MKAPPGWKAVPLNCGAEYHHESGLKVRLVDYGPFDDWQVYRPGDRETSGHWKGLYNVEDVTYSQYTRLLDGSEESVRQVCEFALEKYPSKRGDVLPFKPRQS